MYVSHRLMDHFRALGCSVSKKSAAKSKKIEGTTSEAEGSCKATLKIPLSFPVPRKRRRKTNLE